MCENGKPAFMRIVADVNHIKNHNKYLLRPLVGGEVVKISANQDPSGDDMSAETFQRLYVRIIRKDDNGVWNDVYVTTWDALEPLKKSSNK